MRKKIAIIGASFGQMEICLKARELGLYSIAFAWEQGALCKNIVDKFYPISILDMDKIVDVCKLEGVSGVVTNASDLPSEVAAYVSEKLGLIGNSYSRIKKIEDKAYCRSVTKCIDELSMVNHYIYDGAKVAAFLPCVVKPESGGGKTGVSFVDDESLFMQAIEYSKKASDKPILIEQYIEGREISVESISYKGRHYVLQITDKDSSGPPHFVELGHHQPSLLPDSIKTKVRNIVKKILEKVGYQNGPSHIELKITDDGRIYLIEVNPRGGGDYISNKLVYLSTGYDYVRAMIEVALDDFEEPVLGNIAFSGVYFLCKQTERLLPLFLDKGKKTWMCERELETTDLIDSLGNSSRNGYFIYKSDKKIVL